MPKLSQRETTTWCVAVMLCDLGAVLALAIFIGPLASLTTADYRFSSVMSAVEFFGSLGLVWYMANRAITLHNTMKKIIPNPLEDATKVVSTHSAPWVLKTGCMAGMATLVFLMLLILL